MSARCPPAPIEADLEAFFAAFVAREPEEATPLGIHDGDDRLRDVSECAFVEGDVAADAPARCPAIRG